MTTRFMAAFTASGNYRNYPSFINISHDEQIDKIVVRFRGEEQPGGLSGVEGSVSLDPKDFAELLAKAASADPHS